MRKVIRLCLDSKTPGDWGDQTSYESVGCQSKAEVLALLKDIMNIVEKIPDNSFLGFDIKFGEC